MGGFGWGWEWEHYSNVDEWPINGKERGQIVIVGGWDDILQRGSLSGSIPNIMVVVFQGLGVLGEWDTHFLCKI